jgi:hypothetical protein
MLIMKSMQERYEIKAKMISPLALSRAKLQIPLVQADSQLGLDMGVPQPNIHTGKQLASHRRCPEDLNPSR